MRTNLDYLSEVLCQPGDYEGPLMHKPPKSAHRAMYDSGYKERWFKLMGNLLLYYKLNEHGGVSKHEASGVLVLENVEVRRHSACPVGEFFGFAISWKDDLSKSHYFYANSEAARDTWLARLALASYECQSGHLLHLRLQIRRRTGKDPLEHELGRPELFPTESSCFHLGGSSSVCSVALSQSDAAVSKSHFYTNTSWYGSSPCLASSGYLTTARAGLVAGGGAGRALHATSSDPHILDTCGSE